MKRFVGYVVAFVFLGINVVHAEDKPPASMPVEAARDLDYATMKRDAIAKDLVDEMQKEFQAKLKEKAGKQIKVIDELTKKYKLTLVTPDGKPCDKVDAETGKITRCNEPAAKTSAPPKK